MTCIYFFLSSAVHRHHKQQSLNYSLGNTGCQRIEAKNEKIQAFPTIMIEKNGLKYEYNGERSVDGLVRELIPNIQLGGKRLRKYKIFYN